MCLICICIPQPLPKLHQYQNTSPHAWISLHLYLSTSPKAPSVSEHITTCMDFSPATWQLIVTFTPCTVLMVPPISTMTAGFSVLSTVIRDVFTSGFPGKEKERELSLTVSWAGTPNHWETNGGHMFCSGIPYTVLCLGKKIWNPSPVHSCAYHRLNRKRTRLKSLKI